MLLPAGSHLLPTTPTDRPTAESSHQRRLISHHLIQRQTDSSFCTIHFTQNCGYVNWTAEESPSLVHHRHLSFVIWDFRTMTMRYLISASSLVRSKSKRLLLQWTDKYSLNADEFYFQCHFSQSWLVLLWMAEGMSMLIIKLEADGRSKKRNRQTNSNGTCPSTRDILFSLISPASGRWRWLGDRHGISQTSERTEWHSCSISAELAENICI